MPPATLGIWANISKPVAVLVLTGVGGFLDAVGYVSLFGLFTSSITGNVVVAAAAASRSINVTPQITVLVMFFCGATAGGVVATAMKKQFRAGHREVARVLIFFELALLLLFWIVGVILVRSGNPLPGINSAQVLGLASLSALGMGFQNR